MRRVRVVLVVAAVSAAAAGRSLAAGAGSAKASKGISAPRAAPVVWFSGESSQGLEQDGRGNLLVSGQRLPVRQQVKGLYAAAYYPEAGILVTVDGKAVTCLYERRGTSLERTRSRPPREPARLSRERKGEAPISPYSVRFSRIPGLVYLTWAYPRPKTPLQMAWMHSERVALGGEARDWHAATPHDPKVLFLEYAYQVTGGKVVHLSGPDGERVMLQLPDPLIEWGPNADTDTHREPVSVIPGRAILCQTRNGWSMHSPDGTLIRYFPSPFKADLHSWRDPFYHRGRYYVSVVTQGWHFYRFDVSQGKMVDVGSELPDEPSHRAR